MQIIACSAAFSLLLATLMFVLEKDKYISCICIQVNYWFLHALYMIKLYIFHSCKVPCLAMGLMTKVALGSVCIVYFQTQRVESLVRIMCYLCVKLLLSVQMDVVI